MNAFESDSSVIVWSLEDGRPLSVDLTDSYQAMREHYPTDTFVLAGISQFLDAEVIARPHLLAPNGAGVTLTSYSNFVRKDKQDMSPDFEVSDSTIQSMRIYRDEAALRGLFLDVRSGEVASEPFAMHSLRTILDPQHLIGQEGYGVGVREGYFLGAELHFDDGVVNPHWIFGPIYRFPQFPDTFQAQSWRDIS